MRMLSTFSALNAKKIRNNVKVTRYSLENNILVERLSKYNIYAKLFQFVTEKFLYFIFPFIVSCAIIILMNVLIHKLISHLPSCKKQ
jgi:hypothetical protein